MLKPECYFRSIGVVGSDQTSCRWPATRAAGLNGSSIIAVREKALTEACMVLSESLARPKVACGLNRIQIRNNAFMIVREDESDNQFSTSPRFARHLRKGRRADESEPQPSSGYAFQLFTLPI